jgi:hypothetical protein
MNEAVYLNIEAFPYPVFLNTAELTVSSPSPQMQGEPSDKKIPHLVS